MTPQAEPPSADGIVQEAADWFARLQDPAADGEAWLAFERWLGASPAHAAAYERLEAIWDEVDDRAPEIAARLEAPPPVTRGWSRRGWLGAGAAIAAGVAAGVFAWNGLRPPEPVIYAAPPGATREIVLADGSMVHLNAGSRISVALGRGERRVVMDDAEASFDVTHDPARPFLITVGDREVRVVGTEFNIRRRDGAMVLTVRRGVVQVRPVGRDQPVEAQLTRGQQLVHVEGQAGSQLRQVPADDAFAWANGQLIYNQQPLSEVAGDVSRRFASQVRVADARTGQYRFSGVLVIDNEAAVLRRLEAFAPVKAERTDGGTVLRLAP